MASAQLSAFQLPPPRAVPSERFWRTAHVQPTEYYPGFVDVPNALVTPVKGSLYEATFTKKSLDAVDVIFFHVGCPYEIYCPVTDADSLPPRYDLLFIKRGRLDVFHQGAELQMPESSCTLLDTRHDVRSVSTGPIEALSVHMPRGWLRDRIAEPENFVGKILSNTIVWHGVLLSLLCAFSPETLDNLLIAESQVAEQVARALRMIAGINVPTFHRPESLLQAVKGFMTAWSFKGDLTSADAAEAMGISRRRLQQLLEREGTTFTRLLLDIRLEKACLHLRDPRFLKLQIAEVGATCGFNDANHFARSFRETFGMSPRDYRRKALSPMVFE